ncbi:MAG: hypothetical protein M1133_08430 [Armatimonadetes bacterium]|nr:hypothetical protein [Armatimonadota bacterium]
MRRALIPVLLCLSLYAVLGAAFADKITVDPNTPQAAKPAEPDEKPDERLAQKVTYEARHKTVSAILADLTEKTSVTLRSGWNEKDWQVRDRKMNIFAKDVPLADLMSSIARVMKFKWEITEKDGVKSYRLYEDKKALLEAEKRDRDQQEKRERILAVKRRKMVDDLCNIDKLSPRELEKLKQEKPYMYVEATSEMTKRLVLFLREVPEAREALATGRELTLGPRDLSAEASRALVQWMRNSDAEDLATGRVSVQINPDYSQTNTYTAGTPTLGHIFVRGDRDGDYYPLTFRDPESKEAIVWAKAVIKIEEIGARMRGEAWRETQDEDEVAKISGEVWHELRGEEEAARMSDLKKDDSGEPAIEHEDDSSLDKKVKLKPKKTENEMRKLEEIEAALADVSGFAVISDSFVSSTRIPDFLGEEEITVRDALDKIEESCHYNWDKRESVIEFRDRDWHLKRCALISDAQIAKWRDNLKKNGILDIDDLVEIAALNEVQVWVNIIGDDDLYRSTDLYAAFGRPGFRVRDMLKIYGAFSNKQKSAVFSANGLNPATLSPDHWRQLEKLIAQRSASLLQSQDEVLTLRATRTNEGKRFRYKFAISSSADTSSLDWAFMTPEYKEPGKQ